jgi:hypothetical protein
MKKKTIKEWGIDWRSWSDQIVRDYTIHCAGTVQNTKLWNIIDNRTGKKIWKNAEMGLVSVRKFLENAYPYE